MNRVYALRFLPWIYHSWKLNRAVYLLVDVCVYIRAYLIIPNTHTVFMFTKMPPLPPTDRCVYLYVHGDRSINLFIAQGNSGRPDKDFYSTLYSAHTMAILSQTTTSGQYKFHKVFVWPINCVYHTNHNLNMNMKKTGQKKKDEHKIY